MLRSLGAKIGLLLIATAALLWIGWGGVHDPEIATHVLASPQGEAALPLDLNRVTVEELMALPGVGEVIAKRIVKYRENNGFYRSSQQLLDIHGIGETRFARLRPLVTVSPSVSTGEHRGREVRSGP